MRLKKLKIHGFKSFADQVVLDFETEIVALVGPNGCGKSNIVDAFRWVLGEQSAKSMRADKMNEVIFAGTDTRKPLNYAEVALTLTEVAPYDELVVGRRLYRSGESEYFINKEQVRLKDVQALFLGSGVGRRTFSIFEQGKLDEIIHVSPLERRVLFDEAAGIGKFLQNKKEASKHLLEVQANYDRIKDLHHEIDKRRKQLKKQAGEALIHQENKSRLETLEIAVLVAKWRKLKFISSSWEEERSKLASEISAEKESFDAWEKRFEEMSAHLVQKEHEVQQSDERVYSAGSIVKIKGAEEKREKERILEIEARKKKIEGEREELKKQKVPIGEELKVMHQSLSLIEKEKEAQEKVRKAGEEKHRLLEEGLKKERFDEKSARDLVMQTAMRKTSLEKEWSRKKEWCERCLEDLQKWSAQIAQFDEKISSQEKEEKRRREVVKKEIAGIEALKEEILVLENEIKKVDATIKELEKENLRLVRLQHEEMAEEKALIALAEAYEGFSGGAKALLKEAKNPKSLLYQKLAPFYEGLDLKEGSAKQMAYALKSYVGTLLVKTQGDQKAVLDYAKEKKLHDFSIATQEKAKKLLAFLEGELEISDEGFFVDPHGVIFRMAEGASSENAILREKRRLEIGKSLKERELLLAKAEKEIALQKNVKADVEEKRAEKEALRRKCEMTLLQENFFLQQCVSDLKKAETECKKSQEEKEKLLKREAEEKEVLKKLSSEMKKAEEEEKKAALKAASHEEVLKEKTLVFEEEARVKREQDENYFEVFSKLRSLSEKIKVLETKEEEREKREARLVEEFQALGIAFEKAKENAKILQREAAKAADALEEDHKLQKSVKQSLQKLKIERDELEKVLVRERKKIEALGSKEHKLEVAFAENNALKKPLAEELLSRFSIEVTSVAEEAYPLEMTLEEGEKAVSRLRGEIEKGQMVNLTSIEEAKVEEERFATIDKQLLDLKTTKEDIEKIVQKLDQESRKAFKSTFEVVRQNFQKNFSLFFNGGQADLKFTESPDVLEAGVEIFAQPPGKQMRTISLLSGGEKCMTALALLFSIFEVRPAPFCILDEVDAPLDDANVERFTHVLGQFTSTTQFIIVTHNKKTMAIAGLLFGISMEEKGVSKLISLVFEKNSRELESVK